MISYQLRQREYLLQISRALTSRLDLPSLLRLILNSVADLVRAEAGLVALRRGQAAALTILASYGIPTVLLPRFAPLLADLPVQADGYALPDLQARLNLVARAVRLPLSQVIALPLIFQDRLLGVIYLFRSGSIAFGSNDEDVLASFADQAAIAVRNAQLYEQVSAEKGQLNAIIDRSADGVMILDAELRIQVFNRALSQMTGWAAEKAIGRPCYEVLALEDASAPHPCGAEQHELLFPEGKPLTADGRLMRPGVTYSPLYDEEGRLLNVIANVVDITRFREAEEMKSTFVSVISHELKTPVALIKGYANTLAREDANWDRATVREGLAVISEESDRLNALINNLLDASRIQAGGFKIERADVAMPALAASVMDGFRVQVAQAGVADRYHFVADFPADFPCVEGDEERLRQVFNNLLSNAVKYSPKGGEIRVGGWQQGDQVTLYVADQGIGIPEAEQARLFQRFYRVDSSLRRSTQGAGLGLYLCRSIVEAHGGRIWLRSEAGRGTTVFFTLPVCGEQEERA
ncbi:MAG: Sensor histidine kinase YycG [Chloroflexi bacterium ADurb.Bin325]|nr:MAG: Sensor histidine kinase YycG [Chloroflexi bacterium ADurb.Bin325]